MKNLDTNEVIKMQIPVKDAPNDNSGKHRKNESQRKGGFVSKLPLLLNTRIK